MGYGYWPKYVSVAQKKAKAERETKKLTKGGKKLSPVTIVGKNITETFWGNAWSTNLENYSDFEYRLPRGRSYVRNGSVIDLKIAEGKVEALVYGSELYKVEILVTKLASERWKRLKQSCSGNIGSLIELLKGDFSKEMMSKITDKDLGLFPSSTEIKLSCSCPDWATMCKHVAASMYGIGARFDKQPLLLFALRGVDHTELLSEASKAPVGLEIDTGSLSEVFGIEFADENLNVVGSKVTAKVKRVASAVGSSPKASKSKSSKPKISKPKKEVMVKKKTPLKVKAASRSKTEKQPKKRSTKVEKRVVVRE